VQVFIRGVARSAVRRTRTHREEVVAKQTGGDAPDGYRSEGTPSLSEGPDARGERFFAYFFEALVKKVSRRQGETLSGHYRSNGYVHLREIGRLPGRHRRQASSHRVR
jgi:hypothetical protein